MNSRETNRAYRRRQHAVNDLPAYFDGADPPPRIVIRLVDGSLRQYHFSCPRKHAVTSPTVATRAQVQAVTKWCAEHGACS